MNLIKCQDNETIKTTTAVTEKIKFNNVPNGNRYYCTVCAINEAGKGPIAISNFIETGKHERLLR